MAATKQKRTPALAEGSATAARGSDGDEDVGVVADERNPATLREVLAGVDEERSVRMKPSRRRHRPTVGANCRRGEQQMP